MLDYIAKQANGDNAIGVMKLLQIRVFTIIHNSSLNIQVLLTITYVLIFITLYLWIVINKDGLLENTITRVH